MSARRGRLAVVALGVILATAPGCALVQALGGDDEPGDADGGPGGGGGDADPDGAPGGDPDGGVDAAGADCTPIFIEGFNDAELDSEKWFHDGPEPTVAGGDLTISLDGDGGNLATRVSTQSFFVPGRHRADVELVVSQTGSGEALVSWDSGTARYGLLAADGELRAVDQDGPLCDPCPALQGGLQLWSLVPGDGTVELRAGSNLVGTAPAQAGDFRLEILGDVDGAGDDVTVEVHIVGIQDCGE